MSYGHREHNLALDIHIGEVRAMIATLIIDARDAHRGSGRKDAAA
jgi:hypothetical protein